MLDFDDEGVDAAVVDTPLHERPLEEHPGLAAMDPAARTGVLAMSEAHDAKQWEKCAAVGDAWVDARGAMPALCCVWYTQALMGVRRFEEAVAWGRVAAETIPESEALGLVAARGIYAQALARVGQFAKARRVIKELIRTPIDDPEAREKQGHMLLAVSDKWRRGWEMHESRLQKGTRGYPEHTVPWDGVTREPVAVLHEQGIGDAVLAARWLPWLEAYTCYRPTWYGPELLHRWMSDEQAATIGDLDETVKRLEAGGKPLTVIYAMSLPYFANVRRRSDVPAPYAPPSLLEHRQESRERRAHLGFNGLRVGVCWKGAAIGWHDFERSLTPEEFAPIIAPFGDVEFVNLCHGAADVPVDWPFAPVMFSDIYHTGEVIATCDLVVSVDTSVVHIAGSLGVPTVALVPTVPDWRYQWPFGGGSDWYPSVTVVRRKHAADLSIVRRARWFLEEISNRLERVA